MTQATPYLSDRFKTYYQLTKPGIIYGNSLTTIGGFLFASRGHINALLLLATLIGTGLVIGSGCVCNNVLDTKIDQRMDRTKKRALVTGQIQPRQALVFSALLALFGFTILVLFTNILTIGVGIVGWLAYVLVYGYFKRRSVYGTVIGSISGSMPIVAGYTAASNHFDLSALLLCVIMACWQMPHFYAIALYRLQDYGNANIPVLPHVKGVTQTKKQIISYIIGFILACCLLTWLGSGGYLFGVGMSIVGVIWLVKGLRNYHIESALWGKQMFMFSLIVVLALSILLSLDSLV